VSGFQSESMPDGPADFRWMPGVWRLDFATLKLCNRYRRIILRHLFCAKAPIGAGETPALRPLKLCNLETREGRPHPQARPSQCEPARRRADGFPGTVCTSFHSSNVAHRPLLWCARWGVISAGETGLALACLNPAVARKLWWILQIWCDFPDRV